MIIYPQKPSLITIDQSLFSRLESAEDWIAELKFNGDRLILQINDRIEFWNRHGEKFKRYNTVVEEELKKIEWKRPCILDGELLHFKTKTVKNQIILFDVIMWNGEFTVKMPFEKRRAILEQLFDGIVSDYVSIAQQWKNGWRDVFGQKTKKDEIEGLVLKCLSAPYILGKKSSPVVTSMYKVRKRTNMYKF